jgi:hypothetical protein
MFLKLQLSVDETTGQINELLQLDTTSYQGSLSRLIEYFEQLRSRARNAYMKTHRAAVRAVATLTLTGLPTAADTFTLNGVTFTARASGAVANEFNIGADATATAAAIAAAINASVTAKVSGYVTATSALGVVTITLVEPGLVGNLASLSESMNNTTRVDFAGGSDGTEKILYFGKTSV